MDTKEIVERAMCGDARVFKAIQEAKKNDKSFTEKGFLGMPIKYDQSEVRKIWFDAMTLGMIKGLEMSGLEGQRVDLFNSCKDERQKEFIKKLYELSAEYECAVVYHPVEGMCIVDRKKENTIEVIDIEL